MSFFTVLAGSKIAVGALTFGTLAAGETAAVAYTGGLPLLVAAGRAQSHWSARSDCSVGGHDYGDRDGDASSLCYPGGAGCDRARCVWAV